MRTSNFESWRSGWRTAATMACVCVALVCRAQPSLAGPLPEEWVARGSDWVVHVDAERLREAEALRPAFDALVASAWGSSLSDMGIDARTDLTDITMFGTISRSPETRGQTTTILQGGAALRQAIQRHVEKHAGYPLLLRPARLTDGRGISAWTIEQLSVHIALVPVGDEKDAAGQPARLVAVLSDHSERLQECIRLLVGDKDAATNQTEDPKEPGEQAGEDECAPPPGCVIVVRAKDLDHAHPPLRSALLASAKAMRGHLGYREEDGQTVVFASLWVEGNEEADGDHMVSSLNDMIEFWTQHAEQTAHDVPALLAIADLIGSSTVTRTGQAVELNMKRAIASTADASHGQPDKGQTSDNVPTTRNTSLRKKDR